MWPHLPGEIPVLFRAGGWKAGWCWAQGPMTGDSKVPAGIYLNCWIKILRLYSWQRFSSVFQVFVLPAFYQLKPWESGFKNLFLSIGQETKQGAVFEQTSEFTAELEVPQCWQKLVSFAVLKWCIRRCVQTTPMRQNSSALHFNQSVMKEEKIVNVRVELFLDLRKFAFIPQRNQGFRQHWIYWI